MSKSSEELFVAILGAGGVGACFLEQLKFLSEKSQKPRLRLCYLAIIDRALFYKDYRSINIGTALSELDTHGHDPQPFSQTIEYLSKAPNRVVLIDNTSSQAIAESYPELLRNGINIITPNKKAFSGSYQLWQEIKQAEIVGSSYAYHESSVGAGMPIISTLNDLVETGDEVTKIEGVFSGTMSYLLNSFAPLNGSGGKWSEEVFKAKQLGFTEPDPRDDLNGLDVARKLTILGRLAGLHIDSPTSFPVQSLVPQELESVSSSAEFLERLPEFDDQMEQHKLAAQKAGKVVRFVGRVDISSQKAKVGLEWVDPSDPIALLQGSDNIISFYTKRYGDKPLVIRGAGAGGPVTAMGVSSDLLKLCARFS
ncbi:Homoserine dehydrogenase [Ascochyta clinopodiicola]|nr:Homoserine dehydrogenase [Ascochyta clinopodiicola]